MQIFFSLNLNGAQYIFTMVNKGVALDSTYIFEAIHSKILFTRVCDKNDLAERKRSFVLNYIIDSSLSSQSWRSKPGQTYCYHCVKSDTHQYGGRHFISMQKKTINMEEGTFSPGYNNRWRHRLDSYTY